MSPCRRDLDLATCYEAFHYKGFRAAFHQDPLRHMCDTASFDTLVLQRTAFCVSHRVHLGGLIQILAEMALTPCLHRTCEDAIEGLSCYTISERHSTLRIPDSEVRLT